LNAHAVRNETAIIARFFSHRSIQCVRAAKLTPEASEKLRVGNYERLFDAAQRRVRAWEKDNVK
jgi:hypothetical protein